MACVERASRESAQAHRRPLASGEQRVAVRRRRAVSSGQREQDTGSTTAGSGGCERGCRIGGEQSWQVDAATAGSGDRERGCRSGGGHERAARAAVASWGYRRGERSCRAAAACARGDLALEVFGFSVKPKKAHR